MGLLCNTAIRPFQIIYDIEPAPLKQRIGCAGLVPAVLYFRCFIFTNVP